MYFLLKHYPIISLKKKAKLNYYLILKLNNVRSRNIEETVPPNKFFPSVSKYQEKTLPISFSMDQSHFTVTFLPLFST
jgi:hypothetical protein